MDEEILPFGKTSKESGYYREVADIEKAAKVIEKRCDGGQDTIHKFVDKIISLLKWLDENGREFPWRYTQDPYRVYVTEVLLRRTQAESVAKIYDNFFEKFPDLKSLYHAENEEIRKEIVSLGLVNRRLRTLNDVARIFYGNYGSVPDSIKKLKNP